MAENKMEQVAKLLGLELEEEFRIKYDNKAIYVLKEDGFFEVVGRNTYLQRDIDNLLNGEWEVVKLPKPILDEKEKEYLLNVIKPKNIINRLCYIEKRQGSFGICADMEFINIGLNDESFSLPYFKKGTMYKGMELDKGYTLEELGL